MRPNEDGLTRGELRVGELMSANGQLYWSGAGATLTANARGLYEVVAVKNGPTGPAIAVTVHVIAESAEQAKLIAVYENDYDPLLHTFFVHQVGVMPEREGD